MFLKSGKSPSHSRKSTYPKTLTGTALLVWLCASSAPNVLATVLYWDGDGTNTVGGGTGTWDLTAPRWSLTAGGNTYQIWNNTDSPPANPADDAILQNTAGTITLGGPITVRSITARTNGYVLTGSTLTLAGGTGVIDVGTTTSVGLTINSTVAGSTGLIKQGLGVLTLNAANTFTGGTTLSAGTLNLGNNEALGTAKLTLAGGTLSAVTSARTLANAVDFTGNTTLGGTLALTLTGPVVLTGNRTVTVNNSALTTWSGGLGETGGARTFTKAGAGNLLFTAASTYTGTTTLTGGTLALGPAGTISGANLLLNGGVLALGANFTRPLGAGPGAVSFGTAGGGFAAYGAPVAITGFTGTPVWGATAQFLGATSPLILNSPLADNVVTWTTPFSLGTGNRTVNVLDNSASTADYAVISGLLSGTGGLVKTGAGRLDLTAANTFSGPTLITAGQVRINTLGNAGVASSLGAPTGPDAPIQLGLTTVAGTLVYTGPATSSDRGLNLTGTTGGGVLQADGTGPLTLSGAISASAAGVKTLTLTGSNLADNTLSGPLANGTGTVALTKSGTGRWILSANNTHSGTTTVGAGTLAVAHDNALGTGALTLAGGTFSGTSGPRSFANAVNLTASSVLGGASDLTFTGAFTQSTGNRVLTANNTATTTFAGPAFTLAEANQARVLTVAVNGGPVAISSLITDGSGTGADGLTKSGPGQLTLSGNNTYYGTTSLSAGTLVAAHDNALGTGSLTLAGGTFAGTAGPRTFANAVNLTASSVLGGASDLTFTGAFAQSTGNRILTANNTATTTFAGPAFTLAEANQTRTLTVAVNGGPVAISSVVSDGTGTGTDGLTKSGIGQLTLSGNNTYSGTTSLSAGTLVAAHDNALGTGSLILAGGTFAGTAGPRTFANAVNLTASSVLGGASDLTFTGAFAQSTGNRILTANNTATTTFAGPTFTLAEANQTRTLTVAVNGGPVAISGVVRDGSGTGAGGLTKAGLGQLSLSGLNTYTGPTAIQAGSVTVNTLGNLTVASALGAPTTAANGTLAIGSTTTTGTLIYTGGTTSTNRVVNLAGTTGGGVLDASGTGALTFTSAFTATGAGNKTLTLTGTSLAANTLAGAIVNNSATNRTSVLKTGAGTWVLAGANTFTGGLTISAGTVRLGANNVLADTLPVTLAGGTLAISGRTDTTGTLALTASSTIDFGASAAAIVFAASNGLTWSGATLTIANYTTGVDSLRFGANASALTSTQLGKFRFVDYGNAPGQIDAFGVVRPVAIPEPAAWAALGGALALGVTLVRRRRVRCHPTPLPLA